MELGFQVLDFQITLLLNIFLAYIAYRYKFLERKAIAVTFVMGCIIGGFGGLALYMTIVGFFVVSSVFTFYKQDIKRKYYAIMSKGGTRDHIQVLSNGLVATVIAILYAMTGLKEYLFLAYIGTLATVTSDTWATELGILSSKKPRLITDLKRTVEPGVSGGVTMLGYGAASAAGFFIATVAYVFHRLKLVFTGFNGFYISPEIIYLVAIVSGLIGCTMDSILGATVQGFYYCEKCKIFTERKIHTCGEKARLIHGYEFFNNDVVNLTSSIIGALIGFALALTLL